MREVGKREEGRGEGIKREVMRVRGKWEVNEDMRDEEEEVRKGVRGKDKVEEVSEGKGEGK